MISPVSIICSTNKKYENDQWRVFPPKYQPRETLYNQLVFSIKYEGINLLFFKKLFEKITRDEVIELIQLEPTGQFCRKIWFLYEFLTRERLPIPDADVKIKYTPLLDHNLQYSISSGENSNRHRITNNLPGTADYYKYFDATGQAEFLYDCVNDTIQNIIPNEVTFLTRYDEFKRYLDNEFEMPDSLACIAMSFGASWIPNRRPAIPSSVEFSACISRFSLREDEQAFSTCSIFRYF